MNQTEYDREYPKNNREYKSSVFSKLFSKPKELLEKCKILKEYAIFVEIVRKHTKQNPDNPQKAFHGAIEECINNNILRDFLISQRAEVLELMLNTFHREWYERDLREEALAEGLEEGRNGLLIKQIQKKLAKGQSVEAIAEALEVAVDEIEECIAKMKN